MVEESRGDARPRVTLTCATTGTLRRETAASLMVVGRDERYRTCLSLMNDRPYESALNRAAQDCMAADMDWWLHIDSDQYWKGNPLDAIDHGVDLVGFPAPIYRPGGGPNSPVMCFNAWNITDPEDYTRVIPVQAGGKLQPVDVIGSGAFLIRVAALREACLLAPFARRYDAAGVVDRGPDVEFCRKWREAGLRIHADFGNVCGHFNTVDLLDVMTDMVALQQGAQRAKTDQGAEGDGKADAPRIVGLDGRAI
jgi:hypothetical protein